MFRVCSTLTFQWNEIILYLDKSYAVTRFIGSIDIINFYDLNLNTRIELTWEYDLPTSVCVSPVDEYGLIIFQTSTRLCYYSLDGIFLKSLLYIYSNTQMIGINTNYIFYEATKGVSPLYKARLDKEGFVSEFPSPMMPDDEGLVGGNPGDYINRQLKFTKHVEDLYPKWKNLLSAKQYAGFYAAIIWQAIKDECQLSLHYKDEKGKKQSFDIGLPNIESSIGRHVLFENPVTINNAPNKYKKRKCLAKPTYFLLKKLFSPKINSF